MSRMIMFYWTYQQSQGNGLGTSYLILTWLEFSKAFLYYLQNILQNHKLNQIVDTL